MTSFAHHLALVSTDWLSLLPGGDAWLRTSPPALVADLSCGSGWFAVALARAYPLVRVQGWDEDDGCVAAGRRTAMEAEVDDRVLFEVGPPARVATGTYDLVIASAAPERGADQSLLGTAGRAARAGTGLVVVADPRPEPDVAAAAVRRDALAAAPLDRRLRTAPAADADLCLSLWRMGFQCRVAPAAAAWHPRVRPSAAPIEPADALHDALRLGLVHFGRARAARLLRALGPCPGFGDALLDVLLGDIEARRSLVAAVARHDDDWFFRRFPFDPFPVDAQSRPDRNRSTADRSEAGCTAGNR